MKSYRKRVLVKLIISLILLSLSIVSYFILDSLKIEKEFENKNSTLVYNI